MKRGTALERALAYAGTVGWVVWTVLNGLALFSIALGLVGVAMSVHEFRRWQRWERIGSGSREGRYVYPRWAWFAIGAVPAVLSAGAAYGVYLLIADVPLVRDDPTLVVLGIIAWIAGGSATERLLVRAAERREAAQRAAFVALPPPPPGPPAPSSPIPADDGTAARPEIPSQARPARPQDPRMRF